MICAIRAAGVLAAVTVAWGATVASAQTYPVKPMRLIVCTTAVGSPDFVVRLTADNLIPVLGRQVVVDNRGGGGR